MPFFFCLVLFKSLCLNIKVAHVSVCSLPAAGLLRVVQPLPKRSVGLSAAVFSQEAGGMMELHTVHTHNINTTKGTETCQCFFTDFKFTFFKLSNVKFVRPLSCLLPLFGFRGNPS